MKKIFPVLVLSAIAFLFFQCHKDVSYIGVADPGVPVNPSPITASLQGNVTDENDHAAAGVNVTAGTTIVSTDANGFFHLNNVSLDKNTSLVIAQKNGYFTSYRVFSATSGCNRVAIKLVKRSLAGTIASSSGGDATTGNGAKVSLSANSVVTLSSGSAYTGDVKVYAAYIDPAAADIRKTIPGSLAANNKNGNRVILSSFGMLAVELEAPDGTALQIKSGSSATITIPIPAASLSAAPASISLWYLDKTTGIWKEEGSASKNGNMYVGSVKHFSFWNCDYGSNAVNLSLTLQTTNSKPLIYTAVKLTATTDTSSSAYGWTDSLGQVSGMVPSNADIKLEVIDECGNAIYTKDLGPLTQNTSLGVITVTNINSYLLTLTGRLIDCNNTPVTNGYALLNLDGNTRYVTTDATGHFTTAYIVCSGIPSATVLGVDVGAQQQGQPANINVSLPNTDAGDIQACGTSSAQFVTYILDDTTFTINRVTNDSSFIGYTLSSYYTYINAEDLSGSDKRITFTVNDTTGTGTFPMLSLGVENYYLNVTLEQPFNVTFTSFPSASGEFYEGSFEGKFLDSSVEHTISATFRVKRN